MKKLLVLVLVCALASVANATLSLELVDNGDGTASIWQNGTFTASADNIDFVVIGATFPTGGAVVSTTLTGSYIYDGALDGGAPLPEGTDGVFGYIGKLLSSGSEDIAGGEIISGITFTGLTELYTMDGEWTTLTFVNSIPEPMTMGLLGLGGLFLRRRSK